MRALKININGNQLDTEQDKMVFKHIKERKSFLGTIQSVFIYQNAEGVYFLVKQGGDYRKVLSEEEFQSCISNRSGLICKRKYS